MPSTDPQAVPPEEEPNVGPEIARWIPYVPLSAVLIVLCVYLIYSEVLS